MSTKRIPVLIVFLAMAVLLVPAIATAQFPSFPLTVKKAGRLFVKKDGSNGPMTGRHIYSGSLGGEAEECTTPTSWTLVPTPVSYGGTDYNVSISPDPPPDGCSACPEGALVVFMEGVNPGFFSFGCCQAQTVDLSPYIPNLTPGESFDVCAITIDGAAPVTVYTRSGQCSSVRSFFEDLPDVATATLDGAAADVFAWDLDTCSYSWASPAGFTPVTDPCDPACGVASFPAPEMTLSGSEVLRKWSVTEDGNAAFHNIELKNDLLSPPGYMTRAHIDRLLIGGDSYSFDANSMADVWGDFADSGADTVKGLAFTVTETANSVVHSGFTIGMVGYVKGLGSQDFTGEILGGHLEGEYGGSATASLVVGSHAWATLLGGGSPGVITKAVALQARVNSSMSPTGTITTAYNVEVEPFNGNQGQITGDHIGVYVPDLYRAAGVNYAVKIEEFSDEANDYGIYTEAPFRLADATAQFTVDTTDINFTALPAEPDPTTTYYVCVDGSGNVYVGAACD